MKFLGFLSGNNSGSVSTLAAPQWRKYFKYIYYAIILIYALSKHAHASSEELTGGEEKVVGRYKVASFNYDHVADLYAIVLWILLGAFVKVGK